MFVPASYKNMASGEAELLFSRSRITLPLETAKLAANSVDLYSAIQQWAASIAKRPGWSDLGGDLAG
jgi:hypothetical protein